MNYLGINMDEKELNEFIRDVNETGHRIENIDALLKDMKDSEVKDFYTSEMVDLITWYNRMCDELKRQIENHLSLQRKNGNVENLLYNKILRNLKTK